MVPEQVLTVSVAVLNHRRPNLLMRALTAISQLDYPAFEIIVVGDQPSLGSYDLPEWLKSQVKYTHFAEANICRARNHAIRTAGGEVVAFIDDDAAPEPDWLTQLLRPFSDPLVATVGGTVRASDGISLEWQGGWFDRTGYETVFPLTQDVIVRSAEEQHASGEYLSLRGVNSAFRRSAMLRAGGFDEAIRYYLDETDMALRLADSGWSAAIVRDAEVHHLLVPNATRGLLRKPGNQHEIAAAKAVFCKKHGTDQNSRALNSFFDQRLAMLDPQMRLGIVRMKDRQRVAAELNAGFADGISREPRHPLNETPATQAFQPFHAEQHGLNISIETGWHPETNSALSRFARKLASHGHRVSRFTFRSGWSSPNVDFRDGVWVHRGGTWAFPESVFGQVAIGRRARAGAERRRVAARRRFDALLSSESTSASTEFIKLPGSQQQVSLLIQDKAKRERHDIRSMLQCIADGNNRAQTDENDCIETHRPAKYKTSSLR